ncbi:MAG: type III pantothenate kinase [Planctomycetota bacterium]
MSERPSEAVIAVDVGNSAVKIAVDPDHVRAFEHKDPEWCDDAIDWVRACRKNAELEWWISSVNDAATRPLIDALERSGDRVEVVSTDRIPIEIDVDFPDRVGKDRLLCALAAATRCRLPVVVVDAGSAVTVDWVDRGDSGRPVFAGGAILPGLRLQLSALVAGTEAIELQKESVSERRENPFAPGRNTQQAIRLGAGAAVIGGIDRLITEYSHHFGFSSDDRGAPSVLISGGNAAIVSEHLESAHTVVPNLVCLGLMEIAEHFAQPHSEG